MFSGEMPRPYFVREESGIGRQIDETLLNQGPPGPPVWSPSSPSELGKPRMDNSLKGTDVYDSMFSECQELTNIEVIDIGNEREILLGNSIAASPHTVFRVPYQEFELVFRKKARELGFSVTEECLVRGEGSTPCKIVPPKLVALDMLVWTGVRNKTTGKIYPVDAADLAAYDTGDPDIDKFKLHISDEKMEEVFLKTIRRMRLSGETVKELYETVIRREFPDLPPKLDEDYMRGVVNGFYRGDDAKALLQHALDGRGKGPMSVPTLHWRVTAHLPMEVLNMLDISNPSMSFDDLIEKFREKSEYFGNDILFSQIKKRPFSGDIESHVLRNFLKKFSVVDLLKAVDPLASAMHDASETWLAEMLGKYCKDLNPKISLFRHHTSDYERELRVSEGAELSFNTAALSESGQDEILARVLVGISRFNGEVLYPLWDEVNKYVLYKIGLTSEEKDLYLWYIAEEYNLTPEMVNMIDKIQPTEKQLKNRLEQNSMSDEERIKIERKLIKYEENKKNLQLRKKYLNDKIERYMGTKEDLSELIYLEQYGQIFNDTELNKGYAIPGVPGTAVTFHTDKDNNLQVNFGWLLSMKGITEQWLGGIIKRVERTI